MCGFVGMVASNDLADAASVAPKIHVALQALQHRGQDSAGIGTMLPEGDRFVVRRSLGAAAGAFSSEDLSELKGPIGVGHVRYPTIGGGGLSDAQPFFYRRPGVLMTHNGNVTNYEEAKAALKRRSIHLLSGCDIEPALCEFADSLVQARDADHTLEDALAALRDMMERIEGSYSIATALVLDGRPTLLVVRDPFGIRPAVIGRHASGSYMAASESVALDALGFERIIDPKPGECVVLRAGEEPVRIMLKEKGRAPCVFEHIYFARPDSVIENTPVYDVRLELGRSLAERVRSKGVEIDVVVPVPDTARPAATMLAETLCLPLREGLIKNRYSGRTFIMPDVGTRKAALRLKLNPLPSELKDKRVLLVDDSIVRGATLGRVVGLVREAGALEVHLAIHSPPVRHPCFYGIDMSTEEELFARRFESSGKGQGGKEEGDEVDLLALEVEAAAALGAESLTYLPVSALDRAVGPDRCAACFDGKYPLQVSASKRESIISDRRDRA